MASRRTVKTRSIDEPARGMAAAPRAWLVRVGCASAPMAPPLVIRLDDRERVCLGRRDDPPRDEVDLVETADPWMSGEHAELSHTAEGWLLRDLGSSNGTLVGGQRCSSALLHDGDVFETGGTFWLLRVMVLTEAEIPGPPVDGGLGSLHPPLVASVERLRKVAPTRVPVMLLGATGTGKEVFAKALHELSGRTGPFLAINTAAIQPNLIASELFGVEKGAHSTAERSRLGQIRSADGGTVLLDEIGDMPLEVQASLLRVLQESEVVPVGGDAAVPVDVRVVCATHQELKQMVDSGGFRSDLYARLKGTIVELPCLEDRLEDVGLLIGRFLRRYGAESCSFTPAAYRALLSYTWPLNIRELERAVETAVALRDGEQIEAQHLPEEIQSAKVATSPPKEVDDKKRELVRLLGAHKGNVSAVARTMGRSRMQVHRWLKQYALDPSDYRGS